MRRLFPKLTVLATIVAFFFILYLKLAEVYPFSWRILGKYLPLLFDGLLMTLQIVFLSLFLALICGLGAALLRISKNELLLNYGKCYVWFFRNMPLLVIILLFYYGIGSVISINRFWAAVVALALFEGAYIAEILRAGIEAVPEGEKEAAKAIGLSGFQTFFSVIFPQAMRIAVPPLIGQLVSLVKDSSLVSVIALNDLTMRARQIGTQTLASLEIYLLLALVYVGINTFLTFLGAVIEKKWAIT
jgi:polar amino acid transport system permease protein